MRHIFLTKSGFGHLNVEFICHIHSSAYIVQSIVIHRKLSTFRICENMYSCQNEQCTSHFSVTNFARFIVLHIFGKEIPKWVFPISLRPLNCLSRTIGAQFWLCPSVYLYRVGTCSLQARTKERVGESVVQLNWHLYSTVSRKSTIIGNAAHQEVPFP